MANVETCVTRNEWTQVCFSTNVGLCYQNFIYRYKSLLSTPSLTLISIRINKTKLTIWCFLQIRELLEL